MTVTKCTIKATEARQHGRRMLVGCIAAAELTALYERNRLVVDTYTVSNPDGYQRTLSKTRSRKFGKFIQDENNISPTTVLIYCRDVQGGVVPAGEGKYEISLNDKDAPMLYICDGQHRTDGISEALKEGWLSESDDYDVPVTILFWDPVRSPNDQRLEEAMQFYTINTQQKRMRTDLAHKYIFKKHEAEKGPIGLGTTLPRLKKREYVPYAIYITEKLRTDNRSPWKDRILPPNAQGDLPTTEGSFTDSLTPVIDYAISANLAIGEVVNLLSSYWGAIFKLCPNAYKDPRSHVLMKTPGIFSLHMVLPILLIRKPNLSARSSPQDFESVLGSIAQCFSDEYWESETGEAGTFGTGRKAFQELADAITQEIH